MHHLPVSAHLGCCWSQSTQGNPSYPAQEGTAQWGSCLFPRAGASAGSGLHTVPSASSWSRSLPFGLGHIRNLFLLGLWTPWLGEG